MNLVDAALVAALAAALLAAPVPAWRFCWWHIARRRRSLFAIGLAGLLVLYCGAIALASFAAPSALRWIASVVAAVGVASWLMARPNAGARWRLPPGRLHWLPVAPFTDPDHLAEQGHEHGPIFKVANTLPTPFLHPTVCVVGLDLGRRLLVEHDHDLISPSLPSSRAIPNGFLRHMTPDAHDRYAPLFRASSSILNSFELTSDERHILHDRLVLLDTDAALPPIKATFEPFVRTLLIRLILGIDGDVDRQSVERHLADLVGGARRWKSQEPRRARLAHSIDDIRRTPNLGPDSLLARAMADRADRAEPGTIIGNALQMVALGSNDVAELLAWALHRLATEPHIAESIASSLCSDQDSDAPEKFVRELLRLHQSEHVLRRATRTIDFEGYRIPRGWYVRICVQESHRLPDSFECPAEFDMQRFDELPDRHRYAPFGLFRHQCIGAGFTIRIGGMVVREIIDNWLVEAAGDPAIEHLPSHWGPNPRFRVRLLPGAPAHDRSRQ